jgi:hypothetical protein
MAQEKMSTNNQPQEVSLFEALEALEKVKIHILQQERDKNRMMEEYAQMLAERGNHDFGKS